MMFLAIIFFIFKIFNYLKLAVGFILATINLFNFVFNNKIPSNICAPEVMEQYLEAGGDPNATQ